MYVNSDLKQLLAQAPIARFLVSAVLAATIFFLLTALQCVDAAPIDYGSFQGATVNYLNVKEDATTPGDAAPLFGAPNVISPPATYPTTPCVMCAIAGDALDFDPTGFSASASGTLGNDHTDGNLTFIVQAHSGRSIQSLQLAESGDTTLFGFSTVFGGTFTSVTAVGILDILEVDGNGIGLSGVDVPFSLVFTPSGGTFDQSTDGVGGPHFNTRWDGYLSIDIHQVLVDEGVSFNFGATKIGVNLDNALTALSEDLTTAVIAKKDFGGVSVTVNNPEPASWVLVGIGLAAGAASRRRSSK